MKEHTITKRAVGEYFDAFCFKSISHFHHQFSFLTQSAQKRKQKRPRLTSADYLSFCDTGKRKMPKSVVMAMSEMRCPKTHTPTEDRPCR